MLKCKAVNNEYMRHYMATRRLQRRETLVNLAGGKCSRCRSLKDLEFDHRDRTTRLFNLSGCHLDRSWAKIIEELAKCDLLCAECHKLKTKEAGDNPGGVRGAGRGSGRVPEHGTAHMYIQYGCRCRHCQYARAEHRVGRIEYTKKVKAPNGWQSKRGRRFRHSPVA